MQQSFATDIRGLLRGEEDTKKVADSVTLQRLQKNIDEWTALEYSKRKVFDRLNTTRNSDGGRKSTTASTTSGILLQHLLVPSKKIPEEYLTTTPSVFDDVTPTENSVATAIPSFKKGRSTTTSTTPLSPFYDHDTSGSYTHTVPFASNKSSERDSTPRINENIPLNDQRKGENHKWNIIPEAVAAISKGTTTTSPPTTTTTSSSEGVTDIYTNTGHTTWDQIPLLISPITNEKVYVVTPVTTWPSDVTTPTPHRTSPYPTNTHSTSINDVFPFRNGPPSVQKLVATEPLSFKSPRFIIRPTPGTILHRSLTVTSMGDEDDWNDVKTTTLEPVKLNEIDGNTGKINRKLY